MRVNGTSLPREEFFDPHARYPAQFAHGDPSVTRPSPLALPTRAVLKALGRPDLEHLPTPFARGEQTAKRKALWRANRKALWSHPREGFWKARLITFC